MAHGWLAADKWFTQNTKSNQLTVYRDPKIIQEAAARLRTNHIRDVFPHLCPTDMKGNLPATDPQQIERFLDGFDGFRVMPWVGGPNGTDARIDNQQWRSNFVESIANLIVSHPRLSGIQINIEPLASGDTNFLALLDTLRTRLPHGKIISIAAYPPPTLFQPGSDVHWNHDYFSSVARRSDQMAVMMYDTALHKSKLYQNLMADWTDEVLDWSSNTPVLLGVPTYNDQGVDYHDPRTENLRNALLGIHRGLARQPLAKNYQGVAIYCDWTTQSNDWEYFENHFLRNDKRN